MTVARTVAPAGPVPTARQREIEIDHGGRPIRDILVELDRQMTQAEIAHKFGVSRQSVVAWFKQWEIPTALSKYPSS